MLGMAAAEEPQQMEATSFAAAAAGEAETALLVADADPETAFLQQKDGGVATGGGFEWEVYKENVRPLKRGRDVKLLNHALRSQVDRSLNASLLRTRRRMIEAIDEYQGEDPLQPWLRCIKWVQESFPTGGECSGLIVMYEQCVRTFWHDDRYRDDLRYLRVWLEYADSCADAEVIFQFLEANQIGQSHSIFYTSYAMHLESKNKLRKADEILNLGLARKARSLVKLEDAYRTFLVRSTQKKHGNDEGLAYHPLPIRSFGTVLTSAESRRQPAENFGQSKRMVALQRIDTNKPLTIYKDANTGANDQCSNLKANERSWSTLGSRSDRSKENVSIPKKWSSYKVPQKIGQRTGSATSSTCIEVYVDEECAEYQASHSYYIFHADGATVSELMYSHFCICIRSPPAKVAKNMNSSVLKLRQATSQNLKNETEMLKVNPLRNFHLHSLR
ncbi:mitotic spindle checkpoint protein BUBR1-like isoform X2 [Musa acuminata AAA Group]|uniref:mitotic spindle checkpoint protein BUBR1-like isoform X2 n=1 Tax=Musa acuminata AAA Group TaxID=214697 RepID=UPI0031D03AE9